MRISSRGSLLGGILILWIAANIVLIACGGGGNDRPRDAAPGDGPGDGPGTDSDGPTTDGRSGDGPRDGGGSFVCDPVHQTGCGVGEKCDIAPTGTFGCVSDGSLADFTRCPAKDQPSSCATGLTCSGTFSAAFRCTQLCSQLDNRCRAGEPCDTEHTTSDGKQYLTCTTHEACNPILDDCAEPSTHCTYLVVRSACVTTGTVSDGAACQVHGNTQDCLPGSACISVGQNLFKCARMCNLAGGAPACEAGVTCAAFATVGPQPVGICPPG